MREIDEFDQSWMQRALAFAEQGTGLASPNPTVGCVIVAGGDVVGAGFHQYDNKDHAEIVALRQAAARAHGATAYLTLEPCSFTGRTGPCTDALIAAGISRVVVATEDPNPRVSGEGLRKLRQVGIAVDVGTGEVHARVLNDAFAKFTRTGAPLVTQKIAMSLDGKIAPGNQPPGSAHYITGPVALAEVHRMRHAADAILTGVGTVLADNPLLTDRSGLPRRLPLMRIVLDSQLRLPPDCQLVQTAQSDLLVFTAQDDAKLSRSLAQLGVRIEVVPADAGQISLLAVFTRIAELGFISVLIEAGSRLNSALLHAHITDKLAVFTAPVILGSEAVPAFADGAGFDATRCTRPTYQQLDSDILFTGYLRDPWAGISLA